MNGRFTFLLIPFLLLLLPACSRNGQSPPPDPTPDVNSLHLETFDMLWSTIHDNYVYDDFPGVDWQAVRDEYRPQVEAGVNPEAFAALVQQMLQALPVGATAVLQTRDERLQAALEDSSSYEGIGAYVAVRNETEDPRVILLSIISGSPAEEAGLVAHTSVLAINGVPIAPNDSQEAVVSQVRGPAGSDVILTVRVPGGEPYDVTVTRGRVQLGGVTPLEGGRLGGEQNIAYFLFPPVPYQGMDQDLVAGMTQLAQTDALDGIILDLRIATVDEQWPLTNLLGLFGNGNLGEFYTREETTPVDLTGEDILDSQNIPLAIIVSPETSGIPEIFAAALQASGRAIIVGKTTSGELELINSYFLPDGSQLFLPYRSFRTSDGREVGLLGIEPDVALPLDWDAVTFSDDPVREAAVEALSNG